MHCVIGKTNKRMSAFNISTYLLNPNRKQERIRRLSAENNKSSYKKINIQIFILNDRFKGRSQSFL